MLLFKTNPIKPVLFTIIAAFTLGLVFSCDYGVLGGADKSGTLYPGHPLFEEILSAYSGVWYSHYAGIGRLDGYRIGKWDAFDEWGLNKAEMLFPGWVNETYTSGAPAQNSDYILLYDDTVYGQADDTKPGQESWGFGYMGVVRGINIFNGDPKRGSIIIEYLKNADPRWLWDAESFGGGQGLQQGEKPFFGIYYRELDRDTVQMANAVDLAAMYAGEPYHTEKATLEEAVASNTVENEAEFISWGVVIPQDRER